MPKYPILKIVYSAALDLLTMSSETPDTGVEFSYAYKSILKIGFRDDKPKVLKQLIQSNIVGVSQDSLYYLI